MVRCLVVWLLACLLDFSPCENGRLRSGARRQDARDDTRIGLHCCLHDDLVIYNVWRGERGEGAGCRAGNEWEGATRRRASRRKDGQR